MSSGGAGNHENNEPVVEGRKDPTERQKRMVWAAAAGRCTFCNRSVLENELMGEPVPIGELAHNVGAKATGPRGGSPLSRDDRAEPENLLLVCRNCHKPVDEAGEAGRWSVEELRRRKWEHEERIRVLTDIGADRAAYLIRMVGHVRGVPPELSKGTVLAAATSAGLYPQRLPGSHFGDIDLDLRGFGDLTTPSDFARCVPLIDDLVERVHDGIRREAVDQVAVFAFARISLLTYLGAKLDDKVPALVFNRHRVEGRNAWTWPEQNDAPPSMFETIRLQEGSDVSSVAVLLSLSGTVRVEELPASIDSKFNIYEIAPTPPTTSAPNIISSVASLANFETQIRGFLAKLEADHGKIDQLHVFAAAGVAPAVVVGRTLMPHVSPALLIYERSSDRSFFLALEVRR